eukprot:6788510-Karenia_brevis.AAC.1
MKTGPNPQDLVIVRAVAPNHKDLATIQMFKLWTYVGTKQAFSNTTRQFTVADLIKDMIEGSEQNAWMMLRDVAKRTVMLANPLDATS